MKNNFQSKSVPRGARTIWRYLGALFILFTFAVGNVWADTFTASDMIVQNSGKTAVIGTTKNHVTVYSPGITSTSSQQIWKDGNTAKKEATVVISADASNSDLQNRSGSYIEIIADDGYTLGTTIGIRGGAKNSSAKIAPIVWWKTTVSSTIDGGKFDLSLPENTITSSSGADLVVTIPSGMKIVRIYRKVRLDKTTHTKFQTSNYDDIGGGSAAIASVTATAVADASYTVTLNPNDGSYASTPEGWTAGTDVFTKTVSGGTALAIPEPSRGNYDFDGWKSGTTSVALTDGKLTVSKDTTLTAQWVPEKKTPTVTFNDGAYVVGASALDLSTLFESQNTSAVTFALKVASDDATISGSNFTATKAGSYVVVAIQAADANYKAVSEEATVVVTYPATGEATISYVLDVTNNGTTLQTTKVDKNVSTISASASADLLAGGLTKSSSKGTHNGTRTLGINTLAEETADKYFNVTFSVADDYMFTPSAISLKVLTIGGNATSYKAVLTDGVNSIIGTVDATNDSEKTLGNWIGLGTTNLSGTVTLKLYAWYTTSGSFNAYRLSTPITISGTVAVKPSPAAPSISAPDADQAAVYDLNDVIAPLEITASGYPTPTYQWYKNSSASTEGATAIEGAQSASYTPANDVASDLYYYCVATNSQGSAKSHYFHVAVNAPAVPTIYTETTALTLTSNKIAKASETFTFSGANLGETAVTLVLASAVDGLTLSESSVTPTAGAIADTEITVSYKSLLDVAETDVNLYLKQGDDILKTIVLTYSSTAGIESLTSISAATTWDWNGAADAAYGTLGQNDMIVLANADVTWDAGFNALAIAGKLQHYYRDSKYAQGHELKFNTTIPGRVTVTFSNTGGKDIARAPRITDVNGSYAPTAEEDGSKNTTAKTYSHNVAAGDVLIAGFEMQTGTPANMLRFYKVEFVPTYTVAYAANGGSGDMTDANAYVAGDEVTLLANSFTPATGFVWSGWTVKDANNDDVAVSEGKFTMPASNVTVTAQWDDASKVAVIVETSAKYESLADAVAAATDGQTIQLLQNNNVTAQVEVAGKAITLDLAGYKIEYTGTSTLPSGVILVHNGASLTIDDSSDPDAGSIVSGEKAYAAIALTKAGDDAANPATLVVNGGTLTGYYYGITGNGSRHNTVTTINGGTITGTVGIAIYHPQVGTLTVNNGSLTGVDAAIEMRAGTLVINDGTFTATATEFSCNPNGSGSTTSGAAIAIAQHTTKKDIEVTINGGTFNGLKALNESNPQVNDPAPQVDLAVTGGDFTGAVSTVDVDHFISGGTYDAPVTNENCAEGFVPSPVNPVTGKYSVEPKDGTSLIKAVATAKSQDIEGANLTGVFKGAAHIETSNDYKMDTKKYFMVQLVAGQNFQAGDIVKINVSAVNDCNGFTIYSDIESDGNFIPANLIIDTHDGTGAAAKVSAGINEVKLPETFAGSNKLYVGRASGADKYLNAGINQVEVTRAMNPQLLAITIDGRDGVINEAAKTVAVQIPYEADLANLTIVPTIAWNAAAAENSIVVNNGSAWVEDDNTYKLTDKDGDYTVYTITLTRDVLKHTVSFNTHGGSAVASEEVVHGEYLAAAPADPEKEENVFKHWAETEDGEAVDVTTVQINADKTFHAVWEAEPAGIKLFNGNVLNTTNFISAAATTIEISEVEYPCLVAFASNRTSLAGAKQGDLVMYSATTDAAKIKFDLYNANSSAKTAYVWVVEEGDAEATQLDAIEVAGTTRVKTAYYEFNGTKNRTVYLTSGSKADIKVLQAKVIESGSAIKQFGDAGYTLKLNQGRIAAATTAPVQFEGATVNVSSDYAVLNNSNLSTKSYIKFTTTVDKMILHVEKSGGKFYVSQDPEDKGTIYNANTDVELTPAGEWYLGSETSGSAASFTNIAFIAPKCAEPAFNALANSDVCAGDGYVALDGTATVADAGVPTYQWYREDNSAIDGETNATYTPAADGKYYVIAVNHLAGYTDNEKKSALVTVTTHAGTVITEPLVDLRGAKDAVVKLTITATGKNLNYAWKESATIDGTYTDVAGAADENELDVTITEGMDKYYKVIVHSDCGVDQESVAHVTQFVPVSQQDVTASIVWDWTEAASVNEIKLTASTTPKKNEGFVMANGAATVYNNANFQSDKLYLEGEYIIRTEGGKLFQGQTIKFNTTVAGAVRVTFSHTGSNKPARELFINGVGTGTSVTGTSQTETGLIEVPAGEVAITAFHVNPTDGAGQQYVRVYKIEFYALAHQRTTGYNAGDLGTVCLEDETFIEGANLYELAGLNENGYLAFDEILSGELEAGKPYLFEVTNPSSISFYKPVGAAHSDTEIETNGMIGTFSGTTLYQGSDNYYYFSGRHIWKVNDFTVAIPIPANRCYVDMDVLRSIPAPQQVAPGRRRVTMGVQGTQVATGCENLNVSDKPVKMIINGQLFILRGEKMYDAKGQLVK